MLVASDARAGRIPLPTALERLETVPDTPVGSDPSAVVAPVCAAVIEPWIDSIAGPTRAATDRIVTIVTVDPQHDADDERCPGPRPAALRLEDPDRRQEGRGERDGDDDRADDRRDLAGDHDEEQDERAAHEQPPAPLRQPVEPVRDVRGLEGGLVGIALAEGIDDGAGHLGDHRERRDGHEHPDDAAHREADEQGDQDDGRVQVEGPPVDRRPEVAVLGDVHDDDQPEQDEGGRQAAGRVAGEHDDGAREDPADVRDEARRRGR